MAKKVSQTIIIALGLPTAVSSFALQGHHSHSGSLMLTRSYGAAIPAFSFSFDLHMSSPADGEAEEEPRLVLGDMGAEMQNIKSNSGLDLDFGQIDFLAAAKARAAAQVESNNNVAGDEEWTSLAEEKKEQFGEIDDWENSQKEAGNADSHILMFTEPPSSDEEGGEGGEDDEPKLLLF